MTAPAIEIRGLRKQYGDFAALKGVDLAIPTGEVFALLGPNGAGKTTLVEILEGYRTRTAGHVSVLGEDPAGAGAAWRARVGVVLQTSGVFRQLTVRELVRHFAGFYPAPLDPDSVIETVGLTDKRYARCGSLSGGQQRRVDLALGLIGDPELIFMDEPTTGFDPAARRQAWEVVHALTRLGKTVLLTTHYLDEAEALANRVGVIVAGKLVEVGTPHELGGRQRELARVNFAATAALAGRDLPGMPGTASRSGELVTVLTAAPTAVVAALTAWAGAAGVDEIPELAVIRPSLEDVYLRMLIEHGHDGEQPGAAT